MITCQGKADANRPVVDVAKTLKATTTGGVTDENNLPIPRASGTSGHGFTIIDENSGFLLNKTLIDRDAGYMEVDKSGYFTGSGTLVIRTELSNSGS